MSNNLVFMESDEEKNEQLKQAYQGMFSQKFRHFLSKRLIFKMARGVLVAKEKTFFPNMKRKKFITRVFNNWAWTFRYGDVNIMYNRFGLDIKNYKDWRDYLDKAYIKKDRVKQHHNNHPLVDYRDDNVNVRYSIIADNKHVFYSYLGSMVPNNIPKTHFVFKGDELVSPVIGTKTRDAFKKLPDGKYICKPVVGAHGDLIVALTKEGKNLKLSDDKVAINDLIEASKETLFLVQEFIVQHEKISKLNPKTVNTLRIISTRWNEDTNILAAMIRIGSDNGKVVDNAGAGGTFVGIDIDKGTLNKYGYFYNRARTTSHPVTKTKYENFEIPYWEETIELIKKLHPIIFGFATIGWDIAISENGPVIVEINWKYSVRGIQICNGGLRKRWEELKRK